MYLIYLIIIILFLFSIKTIKSKLKHINRQTWIILLFIIVLFAFLYFTKLDSYAKMPLDEQILLTKATHYNRSVLFEGLENSGLSTTEGLLNVQMYRIAFKLFGYRTDVALNFSKIIAVLNIFLIFILCVIVFNNPRLGIVSAGLLGSNLAYLKWATSAYTPILTIFMIQLVMIYFHINIKENKHLVLLILLMSILPMTRIETLVLLPLLSLVCLYVKRKTIKKNPKVLLPWIILLLFILLFHLPSYEEKYQKFSTDDIYLSTENMISNSNFYIQNINTSLLWNTKIATLLLTIIICYSVYNTKRRNHILISIILGIIFYLSKTNTNNSLLNSNLLLILFFTHAVFVLSKQEQTKEYLLWFLITMLFIGIYLQVPYSPDWIFVIIFFLLVPLIGLPLASSLNHRNKTSRVLKILFPVLIIVLMSIILNLSIAHDKDQYSELFDFITDVPEIVEKIVPNNCTIITAHKEILTAGTFLNVEDVEDTKMLDGCNYFFVDQYCADEGTMAFGHNITEKCNEIKQYIEPSSIKPVERGNYSFSLYKLKPQY